MNKLIQKKDKERLEMNIIVNKNEKDFKSKKTICKIKESKEILCSILLNDGRFATVEKDNLIIIFNKKKYKLDLIIKEHKKPVNCLL